MRELRDDEFIDPMPMTKHVPEESNIRVTKTKAIIKDEYDPDDSTLEIFKKKDGFEIKFTSHMEYTKEEFEQCSLGHKHRVIARKDWIYEIIRLDKRASKRLRDWLLGEIDE